MLAIDKSECPYQDMPVESVDRVRQRLITGDGTVFEELQGLWVPLDEGERANVRYVGSAYHGAGIVLKAVCRRGEDGWYNVSTGRKLNYLSE